MRSKAPVAAWTSRSTSAATDTSACTTSARAPTLANQLGDLVGGIGVGVVVHDHVAALGGQLQGDGATDAARGAGDDGALAVEAGHQAASTSARAASQVGERAEAGDADLGQGAFDHSGEHGTGADLEEAIAAQGVQALQRFDPAHWRVDLDFELVAQSSGAVEAWADGIEDDGYLRGVAVRQSAKRGSQRAGGRAHVDRVEWAADVERQHAARPAARGQRRAGVRSAGGRPRRSVGRARSGWRPRRFRRPATQRCRLRAAARCPGR